METGQALQGNQGKKKKSSKNKKAIKKRDKPLKVKLHKHCSLTGPEARAREMILLGMTSTPISLQQAAISLGFPTQHALPGKTLPPFGRSGGDHYPNTYHTQHTDRLPLSQPTTTAPITPTSPKHNRSSTPTQVTSPNVQRQNSSTSPESLHASTHNDQPSQNNVDPTNPAETRNDTKEGDITSTGGSTSSRTSTASRSSTRSSSMTLYGPFRIVHVSLNLVSEINSCFTSI